MAFFAACIWLVLCSCVSVESNEKGFLMTAPRVLSQESINLIQLNLYNVDASGEVTLRLLKTDNDTVISEKAFEIPADTSQTTIKFPVPSVDDYEARLQIEGEFQTEDSYQIFGEENVNFKSSKSKIIFIQTDKPIYKKGQEVKFRVLPIDAKLKPLTDTMADIWVEDPSGSRIAQWKNVTFEKGIIQQEFLLADEPSLGFWRIITLIDGNQESTSFEVKEYVLPKFELVIKPPTFVLVDAESIPIEICAKYTYGKLVEGTIKINITMERYSWSTNKYPVLEIDEELNGCYNYNVNVSLLDADSQYSYKRIEVFAEVTEKGTGVVRNETKYIERTQSPLNLNFQTEGGQYFKPGLPYKGTIKVTHPDDTPAAEEPLEVCAIVSRERILSNWWATKKTKHCSNLTSDDNGIVSFTVLPQSTDTITMSIEAKSLKYTGKRAHPGKTSLYQPQTSIYLRPWYSPSGSHIQVQTIGDPLACGGTANIKVLFTAKEGRNFLFFYEVISRGQVVKKSYVDVTFNEEDAIKYYSDDTLDTKNYQLIPPVRGKREIEDDTSSEENSDNDDSDDGGGGGNIEDDDDDDKCKSIKEAKYVPLVGSVDINFDVSATLSPSLHVIVYYIREDEEVVADSQQFSVEKCFQNKVNFEFGDEVKQPGTKTTLSVSASPNSYCGIKVVDKSITLLDSSDQLTKEKVFQALDMISGGSFYPKNHCNDKKHRPGKGKAARLSYRPPPRPWAYSSYEDAITAFEASGFLVISDLVLFTRPCKSNDPGYGGGGIAMPMSVGVRGGGYATSTLASRRPVASAFASDSAPSMEMAKTKSVVDVRTIFPDTWLFELVEIGDDGTLLKKETLPHTITEWIGSAVCINEEDGLGLSDVARIKGFQEFFLSFTLPYSVIRGEKLPIIVTVFNYIDKCLPISLELEQSDEFLLLSDSAKTEICVCGGKSETYTFSVKPTIIGVLNFTVHGGTAESAEICGDAEVSKNIARDAIRNPLVIEAEGFPTTEITNYLFCPEDLENGVFKQELTYELPEDVVEGSERAYVSLSGDIMGPTIDGLDRLVRMPTGCGEQNIVLFAPNVFVLDYLTSLGKLTDKVKNKAIKNLRTGYQRELNYRHSDGSYSAFGRSDREGSMFLTSFVLRAFSQAIKYIDIDSNGLNQTSNWIISKQQENGCFPEVGRTLSYSIKGGVKNSNTSSSLTAYVLTSLLTYGLKNEQVVDNALLCIEMEENPSEFQAALFAFTAALAGNQAKANEYLEVLYSTSNTTGGVTYFPNRQGYKSVEIETAAYAVLAQIELDQSLDKSLPIIRWLTQKRNGNGGFYGTQDTVLALEAISEFATLISKDPVDLKIGISDGLVEDIQITEDDRLLLKKYRVPEVPSKVNVEASGTGCGLLQSSLYYNIKHPRKLKIFSLDVEAEQIPEQGCKYTIKVCTRYLPEKKKSSMALLQIKMVSGMVPDKELLEVLKTNRELDLKRLDFDNNELIFYFDELTNDEKCFKFIVEQLTPIGDSKPAIAKVYDYYAKENEEETMYSITECDSSS